MYNDKTLKSVAEAVKQVMEAELSAKQKAIAKIEHPKHKIDAGDLAALRAGKKPVKEGWDDMIKAAKEKKGPQPSGGAGKKAGHSYGGGKQKDDDKPVKEEASQEEFTAEIKKAQAKSQGKEKADVAKPAVVAVKQESVEQVNEKAKWRSSSAAEANPEHDPEEYAHDKLSTGSPIRSKADKPLPYGSIQSRRGAEVASSGPRKGMVTKKSAESLKNRMKANLNKEEVEQIDEAVDMTDAKSVATHLAKKAISLHGISNPNRAAHHAKNADAIEKTIDRVKRSSSPSELAKAHTEVGSVRASVRRMNVGRAMSSAEKSAHKTLRAGVVKHLEKHLDQHHAAFRNAAAKFAAKNEEVEHINERTLSEPEAAEKERLVKSMKKNLAGFKERYGERAKSVMYATATARAKENK